MNIKAGETVAVQGLGGLGHLAIQYAKKMGFRVIAISRGAQKAEAARQFGADEYIDSEKEDAGEKLADLGGAALAVSTASTGDAMIPLMKGLRVLGKLLILGFPNEVKLNPLHLVRHAISVQFWPGGRPGDAAQAIQFAEINGIKSAIEKFPLLKAQQAFGTFAQSNYRIPANIAFSLQDKMLSGEARFRAVITMG